MIESNVLVEVSRWSISLVKPLQQNTKTQHLSREQARWAREKESKVSFSFPNQMRFILPLQRVRAGSTCRFVGLSVEHNSHKIKKSSESTACVERFLCRKLQIDFL